MTFVYICLIILFFLLILILLILFDNYTLNSLIHKKSYTTNYTIEKGIESGEITKEFLEIKKEEFTVQSLFNYDLNCIYIKGKTDKAVIFCHGLSWTWYGMVKYMKFFLDNNWHIFAYDSRNHGKSGGKDKTYGYFEKFDLEKVVNYVLEKYKNIKKICLFGESMGAAVILQYAGSGGKCDLIISDSSFSNLEFLIKKNLSKFHIPEFLINFFYNRIRKLVHRKAKFYIEEVTPSYYAEKIKVPLLIIHGEKDTLTPVSMADDIYQSVIKNNPNVKKVIFEEANHAKNCIVNKEKYYNIVKDFINTYL